MNFKGKTVLQDGTDEAKAEIARLCDFALIEGAIIVEGECIVRCPVDTGHLKGSINRRIRLTDRRVSEKETDEGLTDYPIKPGEAHIGTNVSYAAHVEYGTRFQKAQPFMRPGANAAKPKVEKRFQERLSEKITITRIE